MSLFIGKLSERVRKDELESVFRRFGNCDVRLKREDYGFVDYDFYEDAEEALRALKGRNICGEPLILTWSNNQPKSHVRKFDRGAGRNTYGLKSGRVFDRLGYRGGKEGFDGWRNQNKYIVERGQFVDVSGEKRGYKEDGFKDCDGKEKHCGGDSLNEGGRIVTSQEENGKCAEPAHDLAIDYGNGKTLEFDRYESSPGYDRKNEKEDYSPKAHSQENWVEPTHDLAIDYGNGKTLEFDRYESSRGYDRKNDKEDYSPKAHSRENWVEPTHDPAIDYGNGKTLEFDRYESSCGYDRKNDNEDYSPKAHSQENVGRARIGEETLNRPNGSEVQQSCGEADHKMQNCRKEHSLQRKYNRSELDDGMDDKIDKRHRVEDDIEPGYGSWVNTQSNGNASVMSHQRDKWRVSDSRHDCAPLRNVSSMVTKDADRYPRQEYEGKKQSRNEIESPKRSRSKISRQSVSSSSLSDCSAYQSLTHSQSSKSLPRSTSYSRSRSVSSRANSSSNSQNCREKELHSTRSSSPTSLSASLNQPLLPSPNKIQFNSKSLSTNVAALEPIHHLVAQGQQVCSKTELENLQSKDSGVAVNGLAAVSTTAVDVTEKDQVQEDSNENLTKPFVPGNSSPRRVKETKGFQNSETLMVDDIPTEVWKPTLETHINLCSGHSTIISTEEMCMVLNKSGFELPKGHEVKLTTDDFFGAARLWPWYIIYYRKLKKGPISIENYARRVAQNQEFGIVDKYIRSSSGWGEFCHENS